MKIIQSILTKNPCYTTGRKITVKGAMLHSVGVPQPSAQVFIRSWNNPSYNRACVHAFIDGNSGDTYQTLPWNHRGWHGGGSSNNTHIGVEMCEPSTIKYTSGSGWIDTNPAKTKEVVIRTYNSAVELFAKLCKEYSLNPLAKGVIVSHSEGHKLGIASNHGDPEHIWKKFGLTMDKFRSDVDKKMRNTTGISTSTNTSEYRVKVSIDDLNMRTGPSATYSKIGYIPVGVYTIVETNGKWGRLKSKQMHNGKFVDAWIHTGYTTKL